MKKLLTAKDVCEMLSISPTTLYNLTKGVYKENGIVKAYKREVEFPKAIRIGGRIRFHEEDVIDYLERCAA